MSQLILHPEFKLYERCGQPYCDSLQIAETFGKSHDNVLRDIRNLDCSTQFNLLNFEEIKYKDSIGRKYPKFLLTKDGFTFLVMGYRGKKAAQFKEAYINRFNHMEAFIKSLLNAKMEFPAFTDAVMMANEEPKHYHFSNEINMIYRVVLGVDAKKFRELHCIEKGAVIRPHLTVHQIEAIETLQRVDIGLMVVVPDYEQRKKLLTAHYQKIQLRLTA